jgi:hypothetical protein
MALALLDYTPPIAAMIIIALLTAYLGLKQRKRPEFPGPKGYPIIGNALDFPSSPEWKGLSQLAKKYGVLLPKPPWLRAESFGGLGTDILYLDVVGMDILVMNSVDAAVDLFERKSLTYANRVTVRITL